MKLLTSTADVLIVGAGPTGLAIALALTARGRRVAIVDKQAQGENTSRASVVYSRTLELLEPYGGCRLQNQRFG
jgi:2-polyprenyl-6-methoxyphenol hydroxylase-like FAD-dependent oxidoreductase